MMAYLLAGALVSLPCFLMLPRLLARLGFLDVPGERSSHSRPTPKGGGLAFVVAFGLACGMVGLPVFMWLPLLGVAILSFANDLQGIAPPVRLAAQFAGAVVTLVGIWWTGSAHWNVLLLLPAAVFVVGTCNCYNFMDGINGIAGISGIVALGCLMVFGDAGGVAIDVLPCLAAVIGALIAFLPFNVPKARLFMGDVGSIFIGFLFATAVSLMARTWTGFFVLASFLYPFYADEAVTMAERVWRKESLLQPHRRHLYQFLANERGIAHWKVSAAYGLIQFVVAWCAVQAGQHGLVAVLGMDTVLLAIWGGTHWILKRRFLLNQQGM
jgi:Fuc2NAc and GlcNAc transferase